MLIRCKCGKEFESAHRSSIRCHVCGHTTDLTPFYEKEASAREKLARRERERRKYEEKERPGKLAHAESVNYAGLRFDGVYRTSSPIVLDYDDGGFYLYGKILSLSLCFRRDLTVAYDWDLDEGSEFETGGCGTTGYELLGQTQIRWQFDVGLCEGKWEGSPCGEQMRVTFVMKEVSFGPGSSPECVVGEATLLFASSVSSMGEER